MKRFLARRWIFLLQLIIALLGLWLMISSDPFDTTTKETEDLANELYAKRMLWGGISLVIVLALCGFNNKRYIGFWLVGCILSCSLTILFFLNYQKATGDCICNCVGYKILIGSKLEEEYKGKLCADLIKGKNCLTYEEDDNNNRKNIWTVESMKECEKRVEFGYLTVLPLFIISMVALGQVLVTRFRPLSDIEKEQKKNFYNAGMRLVQRLRNIIKTKGYSFKVLGARKTAWVILYHDHVRISGSIRNNGLKIGTVYVVIMIVDPYNNAVVYFDSNIHELQPRETLRLIDIPVNKVGGFTYNWHPHAEQKPGPMDIRIEAWTPGRLYSQKVIHKGSIFLFDRTPQLGFITLLDKNEFDNIDVFISYSGGDDEHSAWVNSLHQALLRFNIYSVFDQKGVGAGQSFNDFMVSSVGNTKLFILVCSASFVWKAAEMKGGVAEEIRLMTEKYPGESNNFIPVYRNNPGRLLPDFLKLIKAIDMNGDNWNEEPLGELVLAIKNKKDLLAGEQVSI